MNALWVQNSQNDALWEGYIAKIGSHIFETFINLCGTSWAHTQSILYKWFFSCFMIESVSIFRKQTEQFVLHLYILMKSGASENTFIPSRDPNKVYFLVSFFPKIRGILIKFSNIV